VLIDVTLILAVTKARLTVRQPAGHAGVEGGGIGEHCICMAFTSKIQHLFNSGG